MRAFTYITDEEAAVLRELADRIEWTYTVTLTLPSEAVTAGDVWMSFTNGIGRLGDVDPNAAFMLFVCQSAGEFGNRPHGHGMVATTASIDRVESCFFKKGTRCDPITDGAGWFNYCIRQALRDSTIHNIGETNG